MDSLKSDHYDSSSDTFDFLEVTEVSSLLITIFTIHNLFVAICDVATDALAADSLKESDLARQTVICGAVRLLDAEQAC